MKAVQKKPKIDNQSTIVVKDDRAPVSRAHILLIAENSTFFEEHTNENGVCIFKNLPIKSYSIYIAHQSYPGYVIDNYNPNKDLEITIEKNDDAGSLIIASGTGYIPGLEGRLNPILDTSNRTYLYADNIAINDGKNQPVDFEIGKSITLEDKHGIEFAVLFLRIKGKSSLLQYKKVESAFTHNVGETTELSIEAAQNMNKDTINKNQFIVLHTAGSSIKKQIITSVVVMVISTLSIALIAYLVHKFTGVNFQSFL